MTSHHAAATSSSYSPLESLLVLQSVIAVNNQTDAFKNISDALRRSTLLEHQSSESENDKFRPEALQDLYFQLLKDEAAKQVAKNTDHSTPNGVGERAEDAKLANVEDREQLACEVVDKLYARYKDQVIKEIREDEQRYDTLVKELHELEQDEAQRKLELAKSAAPAPTTSTPALEHEESQPPSQVEAPISQPDDNLSPPSRLHATALSENSPQTSDLEQRGPTQPLTTAPTLGPSIAPAKSSPPKSPVASQPPIQSLPLTAAAAHQSAQPLLQPASASTPQLSLPASSSSSSSGTLQPPGSPLLLSQQQPSSHTGLQSQTVSSSTAVPSPLSSYATAPPTPPAPTQDPSTQSILQAQALHPPQNQPRAAQSRADDIRKYMTQTPLRYPYQAPTHQPYTPGSTRPLAVPQSQPPPPAQPQHASQRGGIQLPPFSVNPQVPVTTHASAQETKPHPQPITAASSTAPSTPSAPHGSILQVIRDLSNYNSPRSSSASTPIGSFRDVSNRKPGTHVSPGSSTRWRSTTIPNAPANLLLEQTRPRSISPISDGEADLKEPPRKRPGRPSFSRGGGNTKSSNALKPPVALQGRRASLRASSRTPSAAPTASGGTRTRSPSVASHADELSMSDTLKGVARLKHESGVSDEDNGRTGKRKRSIDQYDSRMSPPPQHQPPPIQAFRNFSRMAGPVMNTINTHRHASMFAHPVKERDAEGYTDIIRRPQDLKSIRAALSNGNRAVIAAQSADSALSTAAEGESVSSMIIQVPYSPEFVPPKGIVNGAQLEQEIMRMFANAVMFNPGSEGVVQDTREMFEEVEANLTSLRALERSTGGASGTAKEEDEEADELAGDSGQGASAANAAAATTPSTIGGSVRKRRA